MLFRDSKLTRPVSRLAAVAVFCASMPVNAMAPVVKHVERALKGRPMPPTRRLTVKEMGSMKGKWYVSSDSNGMYGNPYAAGNAKFDVVIAGVNTRTGDFGMSATDISFEGGYGIPINVSRSYSANNIDEGPLGPGWSLSVDLRTTAGALMESPSAPQRSAPVNYKRRPAAETDANISAMASGIGSSAIKQPVEAVVATDATGQEETIQRDVDGILTPPSWDANITEPTWQWVNNKWQLATVVLRTPDGTVYTYAPHGRYIENDGDDGEMRNWTANSGGTESSPIMKISTVADRHGNTTTYTYGTVGTGNEKPRFQKQNGLTEEDALLSIQSQPSGRTVSFEWEKIGDDWRIKKAFANPGTSLEQYVQYYYSTSGVTGLLTKVKTPGLKETTFGYGQPYGYTSDTSTPTVTGDAGVLNSITDPRGLTTAVRYYVKTNEDSTSQMHRRVMAYCVTAPNGIETWVRPNDSPVVPADISSSIFTESPTGGQVSVVNPNTSTLLDRTYYSYGWSENGMLVETSDHFILVKGGRSHRSLYDKYGLNLVEETVTVELPTSNHASKIETTKSYNFLGAPLTQLTIEKQQLGTGTYTEVRRTETDYAYWMKNKYFQQRAVRSRSKLGTDSFGSYVYSVTDYFDNGFDESGGATSTTAGQRGMTKAVYDTKYGNITNGDGTNWRYLIMGSVAAATFSYDNCGRVTYFDKLKTTTPTYVTTQTTYASDSNPAYGAAQYVFDDHGSGRINRRTFTTTWDWAGRKLVTVDGADREFTTTMEDADGLLKKVEQTATWSGNTRTALSTPKSIVETFYGTSGVAKYLPTAVRDYLGNRVQSMDYVGSGAGTGQVNSVNETNIISMGATQQENTVTYTYTADGERGSSFYDVNDNGTHYYRKWEYSDYTSLGMPERRLRAFTRMNRQDYVSSSWVDGEDEYHYEYDMLGRLALAKFAMGYRSGGSYANGIGRYAFAEYSYDPVGRLGSVSYGAKHWNSGTGDFDLWGDGRSYQAWYDAKGRKTSAKTSTWNGTAWSETTDKAQEYGFEDTTGYLTSATYHDAGGNGSWTYDPVGNRNNSGYSYDALNRMTAGPSPYTYEHDAVGNRTWRNLNDPVTSRTVKYTWDEVSRMKSLQAPGSGATYMYRADGLRVRKIEGISLGVNLNEEEEVSGYYDMLSVNRPTTRYYYDGQMPLGEDRTYKDPANPAHGHDFMDQVWYGLGGRGVDYQSIQTKDKTAATWGTMSEGYPVYDTHGDNVGMFQWSGSAYSIGAERTYDAWGAVRSSAGSPPQQGYCANIGHRSDNESGLAYMRARYYEPGTGRFISEDPAGAGSNWYVYCEGNPLTKVDMNGQEPYDPYGPNTLQALMAAIANLSSVLHKFETIEEARAEIAFWWDYTEGLVKHKIDQAYRIIRNAKGKGDLRTQEARLKNAMGSIGAAKAVRQAMLRQLEIMGKLLDMFTDLQ